MNTDDTAYIATRAQFDAHLPGLAPAVRTELALLTADHIQDRVGEQLSEGMTDAELDEFDVISGDPEAASAWLVHKRPGYQDISREIIDDVIADTLQKVLRSDRSGHAGAASRLYDCCGPSTSTPTAWLASGLEESSR